MLPTVITNNDLFSLICRGLYPPPCNPYGLHWTPLDFDWTLKSGLQSRGSPVDQTGLDWALYQPIWPGRLGTGIHWSPVESSGVHMDYVGEGKDLIPLYYKFIPREVRYRCMTQNTYG